MPWAYKCIPAQKIVEVEYSGKITARDLHESTSKFISLEKEKGLNKFLVDTTEMDLDSSYMDIYDLPTKQYLKEKADRKGRVAIIPPICDRAMEAVRFYENVCRNRGWMVQVFSKRQEAEDWLKEGRSSGPPNVSSG